MATDMFVHHIDKSTNFHHDFSFKSFPFRYDSILYLWSVLRFLIRDDEIKLKHSLFTVEKKSSVPTFTIKIAFVLLFSRERDWPLR